VPSRGLAAPESAAGEDRLLTVPNVFTGLRLASVPVLVYLLLGDDHRLWYQAAFLMAVLGCTDWVDGYLARHLHQVSSAGKVLDPVADRALLIFGVGSILYAGAAPRWLTVIVLAREVLVAAATVVLAALGARRIDVTWFGKAGTFGLMVAFPFFVTSHSSAGWHHLAGQLAWVAALPGLVFSLQSLALYVPVAARALTEGRAAKVAA
jgi:cardiolipin synthase